MDAWGWAAFPWVRGGADRVIRLGSDDVVLGSALDAMQWSALPELGDRAGALDADDIGAVRVLGELLVKRARRDRVPSLYHEPFVASLLRLRGVRVPEYLGVVEAPGDGEVHGYLVMAPIRDATSLAARVSAGDGLEALARDFGVAVRGVIAAGVPHSEIDLKNVLVREAGASREFTFIDFERTRLDGRCSPEQIRSLYADSVPRRLGRVALEPALIDAFVRGYVSATPLLSWRNVQSLVAARRPALVCIDGFAGAGKTELARALGGAAVLSTDAFLAHPRDVREATDAVWSHHRSWYDLERLADVIRGVLERGDRELVVEPAYDQRTGRLDAAIRITLAPGRPLVVEGMYSLTLAAAGLADLGIFMRADATALRARTRRRDVMSRGVSEERTARRYAAINEGDYRAYAASAAADVVFDTTEGGDDHLLRLVSCRPGLLPYFIAAELE
jgi:uridine kinase